MNTATKTFMLVSAAYLLGGGSMALGEAPGTTQAGQAAAGVALDNRTKAAEDEDRTQAAAAKITSAEAAAIAQKAHPGTVVETSLGGEDGHLVWKVELAGTGNEETKVKIDAGTGQVLAVAAGSEDEDQDQDQDQDNGPGEGHEGQEGAGRTWWKFWEDRDKDEGKDGGD